MRILHVCWYNASIYLYVLLHYYILYLYMFIFISGMVNSVLLNEKRKEMIIYLCIIRLFHNFIECQSKISSTLSNYIITYQAAFTQTKNSKTYIIESCICIKTKKYIPSVYARFTRFHFFCVNGPSLAKVRGTFTQQTILH